MRKHVDAAHTTRARTRADTRACTHATTCTCLKLGQASALDRLSYMAEMCDYVRAGQAYPHGDHCPFSHHSFEVCISRLAGVLA